MSLKIINFLIFIFTFVNLAPSCKDYTNFCDNCNILTNLCAICEYPEILVPDRNGGCIGAEKCILGKNFCNECDINGKSCIECEEYYYPDENGGCTYTEGCEISYMGECLKCKNGLILVGRENDLKICKSLSLDIYKNCETINYETGYCSECKGGFFLTSKDHKCIKTENCKEATFGNCISCNKDYYLNKKEDKCEIKPDKFRFCKEFLDDKTCERCEDGYYFDENGICVFTQFCSESINSLCTKCIPGYYLVNDHICADTNNCEEVDKITLKCKNCKFGYYLDLKDYKCKSSLEDGPYKYCKYVENDICMRCDLYHYLGEDSKCSDSYYCSESENGKCIVCQNNYYLGLDNICTEEEKCIYSQFNSCIECQDGYYYNRATKKCLEVTEKFLNCKYSCAENSNICCECKNDFYLFDYDHLCYNNTEEDPFIKCAKVDFYKEKCLKCVDGYFLGWEDNKCSKVENCKIIENENKCLECRIYYCLDVKNQICVDNDFLSEKNDKIHISCNRTNEGGTACAECKEGYEVNDEGICVDIDICEDKENGKCNKCKNIISSNGGYYYYCANEIFGCLETSKMNCLRCDNLEDLYECTECEEGYSISFKSCIKEE